MKTSGFTMKGWGGYQSSPIKQGDQPHTKKKSEKTESEKGTLEDRINLTAAQKKAVAKQKALYDAGEITKEQFESDKKEISEYVDY